MVKSESDLLKLNRYYAIYNYYTDCPSEETPLLEIINPVIEMYKAQNNRLLANILFIKAEIFRLYKKYDEVEKYYQKTLSITNDNNIKIQVGFMRYYLFKIKHIDTTPIFEIMSKEKLFDLVNNENQKNKYGEILFRRINSMELQDPNYQKIIDNFDHRIMPIL